MSHLISIIIPVFKVENYIRRCLNSVINQTYQNLEIILINDGSPDKSGEICDEYSKLDKRIIVIHKLNGGLSDARNYGIDVATGDYLTFLDSDDWISRDYIEKLYRILISTNSDISICNFQKTYNEILNENISVSETFEFNNIQALNQLNGKLYVQFVTAWGKLYKNTLFNEVRYPKGRIHEDEYVAHRLYYKANKIVYTNEPLLFYWQRPDSIMGAGFKIKNSLDLVNAYKQRIEFYNSINNENLITKTKLTLFYIYVSIVKNKKLIEQSIYNDIILDFNNVRRSLLKCKIHMKHRILISTYKFSPAIVNQIIKTISKFKQH